MQEVTRLHPIERYHLWPERVAEVPSLRDEVCRLQGLVATVCAMLGSMWLKKGDPAKHPYDYATWLRPAAPEVAIAPAGAGLTELMAAGHGARTMREQAGLEAG